MTEKPLSGVRVPPPVIVGGFFLVGLGLDRVWPLVSLPRTVQLGLGLPVIVVGVALAAWAILTFRRARTPLDHFHATTALVETGPFAFSRNPIYCALLLFAAGLALTVNTGWAWITLLPTIVVLDRYVIAREERYMEREFGQAFRDYKARVRRWF